ncbi:hypothetical protein TNCV_3206881 [Trichonephila clavipes]|nr:hypothetical protein TNCV_3206881 [Trichonephila clavipes]
MKCFLGVPSCEKCWIQMSPVPACGINEDLFACVRSAVFPDFQVPSARIPECSCVVLHKFEVHHDVSVERRKRDERERSPALDGEKGKALPWMEKAREESSGWNGREESAREKGLVRDWSGKTMSAGGVEK